ncbi:monocarboxylate transporter 4 [Fusarium albosuccineum]|uniref:Monocarboxylate transporter 4 n=1 Tax=Fusarium albosuccineum TaxID=1237068 RepID=A0A8H4P7H1_9HYPO|nr:monocarboxylate transporter 4 [Fusarium albosuccineum]
MADQAWEDTYRTISRSLGNSPDRHGGAADFALPLLDVGLPEYNHESETISPSILQTSTAPPKIGNRFSSESVKILRNWFASHERHPYASVEDVQDLQNQTGLNRQQVTNWFANARRRAKVHPSRPTSPMFRNDEEHSSGHHTPIDTPRRRPTPAPFEHMNPLQRWENSPPEHEAATVHDISRAVAAFSGGALRHKSRSNTSSISSTGTSVSSRDSGSCSSAHSHPSRQSSTSFDIFQRRHGRRRRTRARKQELRTNLLQAQNTYQCTFCTETFKTKYDWQRHEKSLHLSLENWVCSPNGPTAMHPEEGLLCVFCGIKNPDKTHLDRHNQSACIERPIEERTYHRKDHLQQHLRLVHASKFLKWPMDEWKVMTQEIRSRCGFCGINLGTWASRVDHLADHFKAGSTMEHWKGDWGFEAKVIDRIDNAMPPYTPTSAYELIKLELEYYMRNCYHAYGSLPQDTELHFEGCSIILGAEIISINPASSAPSWLWDIFMSSTDIANQARLRPTKQLAESRLSQLKINGKGNIFENCELEASLRQYMAAHAASGHIPSDSELQQEACNGLNSVESSSPNPSRRFIDFLMRLVWSSTAWLMPLRQRSPVMTLSSNALDPLWTQSQALDNLAVPLEADIDMDLQPFGPWMLGESTDQTAFENRSLSPGASEGQNLSPMILNQGPIQEQNLLERALIRDKVRTATPFFINDNNSYRRLKRELSRFVITTMSPNNPNSHIPSDDELKYQARWILYDDDDPWNQTPVDNAEWLREFKRDVGLVANDS